MMENGMGMSPADIQAVVGDNGAMGGNGGMWWIIILFLFIFNGNGGLFGGGSEGLGVQEQIRAGFDQNSVINKLDGLTNGLSTTTFALNDSVNQGFGALSTQLSSCCCSTQKEILESRYAGEKNTCEIINALHAEGEATRALIQANTVQELRDRLAEKDRDVVARDYQLSQLSQTSTILNSQGRYVLNPPCPPMPYCGALA